MKKFMMYYALAAMMANVHYDARHTYSDNKENRKQQVKRLIEYNKQHKPVKVFTIHGVQIEASSKKDAIKKYNHRQQK